MRVEAQLQARCGLSAYCHTEFRGHPEGADVLHPQVANDICEHLDREPQQAGPEISIQCQKDRNTQMASHSCETRPRLEKQQQIASRSQQ